MSAFSEQMKTMINQCGVPVGQLAEQTGISASMLYKIQSGTRLPDNIDTLNRLLRCMACAEPQRRELIRAYQVERIGVRRYECFQTMKSMLADLASIPPLMPERAIHHVVEIPSAVTGGGNVNAVVQTLLEREAMRPGGQVNMMVPLRYGYCFECLSQVLRSCSPEFRGINHLFCLRASATDDARLYNMRVIRTVLPRMLTMEHYEPRYCYLDDPDNGTVPFPFFILTSQGVLLLDGDFESAAFLAEPAIRSLYQRNFDILRQRFVPIMHTSSGGVSDYFRIYWEIISPLREKPLAPIVISAAPSILACISRETAAKYLPAQLLTGADAAVISDVFYSMSGQYGYVTFFTLEGAEQLIETGVIAEMQGPGIPRLSREDVLQALEELVRRARQGTVVPYLFRQDVFHSTFRFCMGLYESKLFSVCEIPQRQSVFADITEATLAHVVRDYADNALLLGDVCSPEESIEALELLLRRYRGQ